jgi:hydroxymethylpyrimidine pyrophosphatase-like HAD family hydrolase
MLRALYVDLDGTLLGPGGSLFANAERDGSFNMDAIRALQACHRADVEVVIYSGRRYSSVFEDARLLGQRSFIFELGCGLSLDGEIEWLTDGVEPSDEKGTIHDQISASGAAEALLQAFPGELEYHQPWSNGRDVSHLLRGWVDRERAIEVLAGVGADWLRLVDNGVIAAHGVSVDGDTFGLKTERVHVYHLMPGAASKARAVARHMQNRGYTTDECIAVGDSREDMDAASVVGTFWLVANGLTRDPSIKTDLANYSNVRVAEGGHGAGVYEAVVTTLAGD